MKRTCELNLSAIILAGGYSSRMGTDKALIEIQGAPLLQRTATLIQAYADSVYIITPWIERYQTIVPLHCQLLREICPSRKTRGPLVAFAQALNHVSTDWVFLLACDLPNLTPWFIGEWLKGLDQLSDDTMAYLPRHAKGWEPLCGFYRSSCLTALDSFIDGGGRSFQQWLQHHPVEELLVSDRSVLLNCNTPMDLQQIKDKL
ncbi:molybdenum cofactor guanylyltransferase [Crocosphaera sp.]|uniref:molybdenum cofactor guanylyltransferase n=1 Tax=Crocosphaera sp. TaxID=2729996 RepID=UPI003F1E9B6F|nr:molybdenum cofactor guanylyltransferase [Crocosphaera sp.]